MSPNCIWYFLYKINITSGKVEVMWCEAIVSAVWVLRADFRFEPSQWEMSLQSNAVSNWLGANLEPALSAVGSAVMPTVLYI